MHCHYVMKPWLGFLSAVAIMNAAVVSAEQFSGTVREVRGTSAVVTTEGATLPSVGDAAEIFFKLAGTDDEISVAKGEVISIETGAVKIEIGESTGSVEKGQLVRITSN